MSAYTKIPIRKKAVCARAFVVLQIGTVKLDVSRSFDGVQRDKHEHHSMRAMLSLGENNRLFHLRLGSLLLFIAGFPRFFQLKLKTA